jgi:hypothetical protein
MTHNNTQLKRKLDDIATLSQTLKDTLAEVIEAKKKDRKESFPTLLNKGTALLLDLKRLAGLFIVPLSLLLYVPWLSI